MSVQGVVSNELNSGLTLPGVVPETTIQTSISSGSASGPGGRPVIGTGTLDFGSDFDPTVAGSPSVPSRSIADQFGSQSLSESSPSVDNRQVDPEPPALSSASGGSGLMSSSLQAHLGGQGMQELLNEPIINHPPAHHPAPVSFQFPHQAQGVVPQPPSRLVPATETKTATPSTGHCCVML